MARSNYAIWWLSRFDLLLLQRPEFDPSDLPDYLKEGIALRRAQDRNVITAHVPDCFQDVLENIAPFDQSKSGCALAINVHASGIVINISDYDALPTIGFVTDLDHILLFYSFPQPIIESMKDIPNLSRQSVSELWESVWTMIFATFEIDEPGDWYVEPFKDGSAIRIYNPDADKIVQLTHAYLEKAVLTQWSKERVMNAVRAVRTCWERTQTAYLHVLSS